MKIIGQQAAQVDDPGTDILQPFHCERIGLCCDTLGPFVLVFSVYIFKADGMDAGQSFHLDALFPYILHDIHFCVGKGRDQ